MWEINEALAGVWEITISSEKESHTGAVGSQGAQSKHRKMITAIILFRRRKCHYYGRTVIFEFLDCNRAGGQEAEEEEKEEKLGKAEDAHGPALDWAVEVGILVTASFTRCCFCFFLLLTSICSIGEKKTHWRISGPDDWNTTVCQTPQHCFHLESSPLRFLHKLILPRSTSHQES